MKLVIETVCCGKPMVGLGEVQSLDMTINRRQRWLCPECGRAIDIVDHCLDEELLEEQLEMFEQARKPFFNNAHGSCDSRERQLKGGDKTMADEFDKEHTATLCATKAGNGYKVVVNGVWFYASKRQLLELVQGRQKACTFRTIGDDLQPAG